MPHQIPLPAPAPHLAFEIAGRLAEVAEPDGLRIQRVQIGEHLDQRVDAGVDDALVAERRQLLGVAHHPARDVVDHLERRTEHRVVVAHRDGVGDGHRGVLQRGHHLVLAGHVVRRRRQPVQRRAAQHPLGRRRRTPGTSGWTGRRRSVRRAVHRCAERRSTAGADPARRGPDRPSEASVVTGLVYHRWFRGSRSHTCSVPLTAATLRPPVARRQQPA